MSYIGRQNLGGAYRQLDDISSGFDGSDTTHTMQVNSQNVTVGDVNQIILSLGGVIQKPGTDFTVSGSTLTFTTAPASGLSFFAILLGSDNGGTVTPTDGSVTGGKLASTFNTSSNVTITGTTSLDNAVTINSSGADKDFRVESDSNINALHVDGGNSSVGINTTGASDATLEIHDSVSLIKMQDTDDNTFSRMYHSAGNFLIDVDKGDTGSNSYFQLGIDDAQVMKITADGAMTLAKQPCFSAYLTSQIDDISINAYTVIPLTSEEFDRGGDYNNSTSVFTAPVDGIYHFEAYARLQNLDSAAGYYGLRIEGTNRTPWISLFQTSGTDRDPSYADLGGSYIQECDAGDQVYIRMYQNTGTAQVDIGEAFFAGYLIC